MPDKPRTPRHPDVEIIRSENAFSRHLGVDVVRFRHRRFDGGWSGERVYDIVRRGPAVGVLLYDPERDAVVLIEQFRLAPLYGGRNPWQVETVAGLIDNGEMPEEVARREVREETGLDPIGELVPVQIFLPATGSLDEAVSLFCARVDASLASGVHGLAEEQEDIRVFVKTVPQIEAMLDNGEIESAHTVILLYWLLRHRDRLRERWLSPGVP